MKYRYYIVDIIDGCVKGTNDDAAAKNYAECEDYFVIEAETAKWLLSNSEVQDVQDIKKNDEQD